jgi:hypothetical protein
MSQQDQHFFKPNFPNIGAKPMKNAAKRAKYNNSWKSWKFSF